MARHERANWRRFGTIVAASVLSLLTGLGVEAAVGRSAIDRYTPRRTAVDPRVVVLAFTGGSGDASLEVAHLRATYYRDIAVTADQGGAKAIGYLDFDSLSFSDGGFGRSNVIGSDQLQRLGVGVVLDANLVAGDGEIPFLAGYRIDPLASELAGLGVASIGGDARTVPGVVRVRDVSDGLIVDVPRFAYDATDRSSAAVAPGLSLRLVELATGSSLVDPRPGGVRLGDRTVPLEDGALRISWSDELDDVDDVRVVSAAELVAGVPDDVFRDAIVLVGTVDPSKTDFVDTPVGRMPEVLVQSNAVNTVLGAHWVREGPVWLGWLAALIGTASVVTSSGLRVARRRWWPMVAAAVGATITWSVVVLVAAANGVLLPIVLPVVATVVVGVLLGAVRQVAAMIERRRLRELFSQYVPASVADQLLASGRGEQASAGERVALTALFCDLRGFTPMAARLQPTEVRALLNVYYDRIAQVIFDHGGTVLQYTGDEVFAVFGAPLPDPDHASRALACARRLFERQHELNDALLALGLPPLNYGIGLHSGDAVAAHVGSAVRMQYSVIGDTINVASRHCVIARAGQIVMSHVTRLLLGDVDDAERLDGVELKGVTDVVTIHRIQLGPTWSSGDPALVHLERGADT